MRTWPFLYLKSGESKSKMNFSKLLQVALKKAVKQEALAIALDLSPSGLSKRINGEVGWNEQEIDRLLDFAGYEVANSSEVSTTIKTLTNTLRIILTEDKNETL